MNRGMVLVLSLWADYAVNMLWLDSAYVVPALSHAHYALIQPGKHYQPLTR